MSNVPAYPKSPNLAETAPEPNSGPRFRPMPKREPLSAPRSSRSAAIEKAGSETGSATIALRLVDLVNAAPVTTVLAAAGLGLILGRLARR